MPTKCQDHLGIILILMVSTYEYQQYMCMENNNFTHHTIPVSRARPTGSAFLAHGFLLDADVPDGVVEMMLGARVIGLFCC